MGQAINRGTFEQRKAAAMVKNEEIFNKRVKRQPGETDKMLDERWVSMVKAEPAATHGTLLKLIIKYAAELRAEIMSKSADDKVADNLNLKFLKQATT